MSSTHWHALISQSTSIIVEESQSFSNSTITSLASAFDALVNHYEALEYSTDDIGMTVQNSGNPQEGNPSEWNSLGRSVGNPQDS